jgi:hypothetical protein
MRYKILLYGLIAAVVSSCSSAYKATQTPDDVYYSPARQVVEKQTAKNDRYEDYVASEDDQYLRMKIRDRQRWSGIDDYTYWNDSRYVPSYNYNYDYYHNSPYNAYAWNNWNISPYSSFYFNPYYASGFGGSYYAPGYFNPQYGFGYNPYRPVYITKNPTRSQSPSVNRPNLNSYRNGLYNNNNSRNNNNQGFGNTLKRVFTPNENSSGYNNRNTNTNTYSAPERSYTPSSSSGSSSSGSSGSSSGVSRPPR